ncbi:DUF3311 domain-containing protein [Jatrophihabitans lederbergiae]|jgi:hypothetical protein|uniref:DUF3311 domain-containing protein n=1 Tax=Jatrophihabitans lederbergiae TaxID=3075547 RepID=A0ABU2JCA2_9ACTN|nr:DUF3311 domain-containing protein [Jatrophihabitans sp. DSM 44399]MDT0262386.1 DUF3311 domain-containing protein [Jatrophihabitans sp. DSM 44399]
MSDTPRPRLSPGVAVLVGILLAIPVLALLIVPIYARRGPELWGFPFFYWYQMLWVLLSGLFTGSAYLLVDRDRKRVNR